MNHWSDKLALIFITIWVGALWAIGYLAAPTLFSTLSDKQLAGMVAGRLFTLVAYVGMASAAYLLLQRLTRVGMSALRQPYFWIVLVMLLLTLAGHFGHDAHADPEQPDGGDDHPDRGHEGPDHDADHREPGGDGVAVVGRRDARRQVGDLGLVLGHRRWVPFVSCGTRSA